MPIKYLRAQEPKGPPDRPLAIECKNEMTDRNDKLIDVQIPLQSRSCTFNGNRYSQSSTIDLLFDVCNQMAEYSFYTITYSSIIDIIHI